MNHGIFWALVCGMGLAAQLRADDPPAAGPGGVVVANQNLQQKQTQAETERVARRLESMVRVLGYHQVDASVEQKIMDEAAGTLKGLSQQQMRDILQRLEKAMQSPSPVEADQQLDQAHDKHREVLDRFRQLIARFEMVRSLEQAAQRFDKMAKEEAQLRERVQRADQQRRERAPRGMRSESPAQHALRQEDIARESDALLQKLNDLKGDLPEEVKPRIDKTLRLAEERHLLETLRDAANHLRYRNAREADDRQIQAQNDLERMARTLRAPTEKLAALQEARDRVQKLIPEQDALRAEAEAAQDPRQRDAKDVQPDRKIQTAQKLASRQTEVQVQTRDTKDLVEQHAPDVAQKLTKADNAMQVARERLRESQPQRAPESQKIAGARLQEAKDLLDQLVAQEEKHQRDPLVGLEKAIEQLDKLIADEKQARQKVQEALQAKKPHDLKQQAVRQQNLAEKAEEIAQKPLAAQPEAKELIQSAAEAMHQASEQLFGQQGEPAVAHQERALADLNKARAALQADAQAMKERREQIAQMEEAAKKLDALHQQEQEIAKSAAQAAQEQAKAQPPADAKPQNEQLAQKQQATKQQTQELAQALQKLAAKASEKTKNSTPTMQQAADALKQQQAKKGSEQADKAAQQLAEAKDALNDALAQKMAEESAAEAMQNPDKVQPGEAAVHVAKALLESKEAAKQAGEAAQKSEQKQQAMNKSQSATQSAQAALDQARALSPQNVMPSLDEARQHLDKAQQQLQQSTPSSAQQSQQQAASRLSQALQALQQTMAAMEKMQGQQSAQQEKEGKNGQQGQKQAKGQKGQQQQKSQQTAQNQGDDKNKQGDPNQNGERDGNAKAEKLDVKGNSTFVNLPARQRELILQALSEKLPPEHAAQIQRYFENIAGGKSATDTKNGKEKRKP
jgi:hypothetical protein